MFGTHVSDICYSRGDHTAYAISVPRRGKYDESEPLCERCQAIMAKALVSERPSLATTLHNSVQLLLCQMRTVEIVQVVS